MAQVLNIEQLTQQLQNTTITENFTYNHNTMTFSRLGHEYTVKWLLSKFTEINNTCRSREWLKIHKLTNISIFPEEELIQISELAKYYQSPQLQELVTQIDILLYNIDLRNYNLKYCYIFQKFDKSYVLDWCIKLANLYVTDSDICQKLITVEIVGDYVKQGPDSIDINIKKYQENPKDIENNKILKDTGTFYYWLFTECAYEKISL